MRQVAGRHTRRRPDDRFQLAAQATQDVPRRPDGKAQRYQRAEHADEQDESEVFPIAQSATSLARRRRHLPADGRITVGQRCHQRRIRIANGGIDHQRIPGHSRFVLCEDLIVKLVEFAAQPAYLDNPPAFRQRRLPVLRLQRLELLPEMQPPRLVFRQPFLELGRHEISRSTMLFRPRC